MATERVSDELNSARAMAKVPRRATQQSNAAPAGPADRSFSDVLAETVASASIDGSENGLDQQVGDPGTISPPEQPRSSMPHNTQPAMYGVLTSLNRTIFQNMVSGLLHDDASDDQASGEDFWPGGGLENGLLETLFGDPFQSMLPALLSKILDNSSSPTLAALLGTDPRHIPWPSQMTESNARNSVSGLSKGGLPAMLGVNRLFGGAPIGLGSHPMPLSQFPRPVGDNGRGMHWIPTISQSKGVVDRFVQELQEMKIKWAVILNGGTDSGRNDYLVQKLTQAGIMPVMRIYTPDVQPIPPEELEALVRHYRDMGVYYYQIYNEPNLRVENGGRDPDVSRYLDMWVPAARAVARAGGLPGFGSLSPGGDMNDLEFLQKALRELKRRGQVDVLDRAWLSVHNYAGGHPIADTGDGWGFFRYREYDELIRSELGRRMPMIGTEGGTYPGGGLTVQDQVERVRQSYAYMDQREPYFMAYSHWIIANEAGGGHDKTFSNQALFRPDGVSPVVDALKEL